MDELPAQHHLPRVLRFFDISVLSSASMGPAYSLASTMGLLVVAVGLAAPLTLIVLSAIMLCIAISFAMFARIEPSAGSSYTWIRSTFGDGVGAYGAWLLILSNFFATMAIAVPAGIYTLDLIWPSHAQNPGWAAIVGAVWIVASSVLLYVGIRPTAIVTLIALLFEMGVLAAAAIAAYVARPTPFALAARAASAHAGSHALVPLTFAGFVSAMTLGIWMSDGWEVSASTSEEVDDDARATGRGGITGLVVTTVVLVGCMIAFLHLGTVKGFAHNSADSLAYVGLLLGGGVWTTLIVSAVMFSTLSTLWTTILYLSRSIYAMGRDRVLPRWLGTLDRRNEPFWSLVVVAVLTTLCELATGFSTTAADQLNLVVNASSVFLGLLFVFSAAASVKRFLREPDALVNGVIVPSIGALALLGVIVATVAVEKPQLQLYALGGVLLGIPFTLWRAPRSKLARQEATEVTSTAPTV